MKLIECQQCKSSISDQANVCPICRMPQSINPENYDRALKLIRAGALWVSGILLVFALLFTLPVFNDNRKSDTHAPDTPKVATEENQTPTESNNDYGSDLASIEKNLDKPIAQPKAPPPPSSPLAEEVKPQNESPPRLVYSAPLTDFFIGGGDIQKKSSFILVVALLYG